jgi:hypothetical protein
MHQFDFHGGTTALQSEKFLYYRSVGNIAKSDYKLLHLSVRLFFSFFTMSLSLIETN